MLMIVPGESVEGVLLLQTAPRVVLTRSVVVAVVSKCFNEEVTIMDVG